MKEQSIDEPLIKRLRDYAVYNTRDPDKAPRLCAEALMLIEECAVALAAVIAVADRKTVEFDMARVALVKARGQTEKTHNAVANHGNNF